MLAGFWACVAEYALSYVRTQKLRYHAGQEPSLQPKSTTGEPGQTKQAKRKACDWMEMVAAYTGEQEGWRVNIKEGCLLYTSPSPRDRTRSRMPSSA